MASNGILRTWHDDRGFGFIAPTGGGRELFVHISAFPRDGSRPTVGETLGYELGRGKDGKPQAVRVFRQALGKPSTYPRRGVGSDSRRRSPFAALLVGLVALGIGAYGFSKYLARERSHPAQSAAPAPAAVGVIEAAPPAYRCDGRTHCSQMTSCAEATFFLNRCPGTQMDGDNDGVPCEQQLCAAPLAR